MLNGLALFFDKKRKGKVMEITMEKFIERRDNYEFKNIENLKRLINIANTRKSDYDIWIEYASQDMIEMLKDFSKSSEFNHRQDCNNGFWDFYEDEQSILDEVKSNVLYWLLNDPNIDEDDPSQVKWLKREIRILKYYLKKWECK